MNISRIGDTIAAPATVPGSGAITVIRVSGPACFEVVDKVVKFAGGTASDAVGYSIKYGCVYSSLSEDSGTVPEVLDNVLVSIFRAPRSYTGEDSAEISCHASSFVASEILRLLCEAGARPADAGEFTRRAFINGKMDLAQAEAVADVIASTGSASLWVAQNQLRGGYSSALKEMRGKLVEMAALLERELDFSEVDVEFADRSMLSGLLDSALSDIHRLTESFRYGNALRNGVPVAIVGAVNSGKSTLLNALLDDDRAIVSDIAGTTRDTVEETFVLDGVLFRFIDTAGLRKTEDEVEKIGISRSYRKLEEASVVLAVLDVTASEEENEASISDIVSKIDFTNQKLLILLNKVDLLGSNKNVSINNNFIPTSQEQTLMLYISAKSGINLDKVRDWLSDSQKSVSSNSGDTIVTNIRHYNALKEAEESLLAAQSSIVSGRSNDIIAEDLRQANYSLGTILGEVTDDEVLGTIFERFCIGK